MSATTQNDAFFIKGLGFSIDAIKSPLCDKLNKWTGEKMILLPSLISDEINRENILDMFAKNHKNPRLGLVSLVPSNKRAQDYEPYGADISNSAARKGLPSIIFRFGAVLVCLCVPYLSGLCANLTNCVRTI